jgi:serine-type D-Ala-D-Ala carboxypeptidase/endopeptidase (penicillin-binding protein 4)
MVQRSDNHLADAIFRTLGAVDGDSTWVGSAGVVSTTLAPLDLDWNGVVLADGSGLSRANRISPRFLAELQSRMWRSNLASQWHPLLAVSASSGTLRYRLRDTVAAQRVYGKTGSLRDVVALTGTVVGPAGRHLHFTVTGNGLGSTAPMRALTDRAVRVMAEELYGCRKVRPPAKPGKRKQPPARLVCAVDTQ